MKLQSKRVTALIAFLLIALIANAETLLLNNRQFEKIDGQWYQIEADSQYLVNNAVITVKFNNDLTESQINTKLSELNCTALRTNILGYMDIQIPAGIDPLEMVQEYVRSGLVIVAEPNTIGEYVAIPDDPRYPNQWHHHDEKEEWGIDSYKAWDKETGNPNVLIAVLDSGTDILHEDLKKNVWVNQGEDLDGDGIVWDMDDINGIDDDGNGYVDDLVGWDFGNNNNDVTGSIYHGTHVAGIVGASTNNGKGVAGVAGGWNSDKKGCGMMISGVGDSTPNGAILDDAILYAAMKGAKVITMSLTVAPSTAIDEAIAVAYNQYNCIVGCASGNGYASSVSYPAKNPYVIAVGASTKTGTRASFSNYGEDLMVVAPGVDIWSTRIGNYYNTGDGTSYAAPQVAAVAGLVASRYPEFTNKDVEKVICLTAMKLPYTFDQMKEYGSWNNQVGYGKLNADRALGLTGIIDKSHDLVEGNYFYGSVDFTNNTTLTFKGDSRTYFFDRSQLNIADGSQAIVNEGALIEILEKSSVNILCDLSIPSNSIIKIGGNSELHIQGISDFVLKSGSVLKLQPNSKLFIENGSHLVFESGASVELQEGAEIVVGTKAYMTAVGTSFNYTGSTGKWLGINGISGSSINLNNVNITGAETGVKGTGNYEFKITNSTFVGCTNGINLAGMQSGYDYTITDNTVIGIDEGRGISITSSDGIFSRNIVNHFNIGVYFILSSPAVSKCEISYNKYWGIVVSGQNAIPQLINTEPFHAFGELNNTIQKNGYVSNTDMFKSAQIGINPYASVFMRYNDVISSISRPGISIAKYLSVYDPPNILVSAYYNYWGSSEVTDDYFFDDHRDYSIGYIPYLPNPCGTGGINPSLIQSLPTESKILNNAMDLESKNKLTPAIKLYEHIIKKYIDTPEYYVATARLPYLYSKLDLDNNELIAVYDEAIGSEDISHKKFLKGMKVATHIKGKRYDDAIAVAEEMKAEAELDEEIILADINIAIANMLKDSEGKSRNRTDYAQDLQDMLLKLSGSDSKEEPAGITENILPTECVLYQNYPNPFNPVTQIKFDLAKTANIKLNVYNISGQIVAELANGTKQAGIHSVDFDGSRFNSGVYYYTLEVNGKAFTQKMILMK